MTWPRPLTPRLDPPSCPLFGHFTHSTSGANVRKKFPILTADRNKDIYVLLQANVILPVGVFVFGFTLGWARNPEAHNYTRA